MDTEIPVLSSDQTDFTPALPSASPWRSLRWLYLLIPLAFGLGIGAGYLIFALPLNKQLNVANAELATLRSNDSQAAVPQAVKRYDIPTEGFPSYGPMDAPITIVEFSDYECPYCKTWHDQVWTPLEQKYGSQIRLVYRDFPLLGLHNNAAPAAEAAHCADEQGKYWEYHDLLFSGDYALSRHTYEAIALRLGLDGTQFAACLDKGTYQAVVQSNYDFASKLGVQSTPTFFINGIALVGAQPFDVFDRVIQMEINGELSKN